MEKIGTERKVLNKAVGLDIHHPWDILLNTKPCKGAMTPAKKAKKKDEPAKRRNVPFCRDGEIRTHDLVVPNDAR